MKNMKINYLKLNNIGPYYGTSIFDLDTNSVNNIVLVGGKNGAGKTTFLRSIKYGLFGCFALGLKTETDRYLNEIKSFINNKAKNDYYVEICFDYIENFEVKKYVLKREWKYSKESFEEILRIKCNNVLLDEFDTKELSDKLRAMTSPQLINSYIFDGEKISNIIENDDISTYLEETFNSIFNIDLINQTKKDLENYLSKKAEETKSKNLMNNIGIISNINSIKDEIKFYEKQVVEYKESLNNLKSVRKANVDEFYRLGGLDKKQQQRFEKKIDSFNDEKEKMNKKIRDFIENDLPIAMNFDLLLDAQLQSRGERQSKYVDFLSEIEVFSGENLSELKRKIANKVGNIQTIHDLTIKEMDFLEKRSEQCNVEKIQVVPYLNDKSMKLDEYKIMKSKIQNNENIEKLTYLVNENKKLDENIIQLENNIESINIKLENANNDLNIQYEMYEKVTTELKKSNLYDNSFILGNDVLLLCDKFANRLKKYKLKSVSDAALKIFNDTIRKENFISNLEITDKFELNISNADGIKINPKKLSAGEMQIMISSLIWAMFKISGRREMFIFDTPLARLDVDNRFNFISKIISTISSQVVVLSTDSEFIGKNLDVIDSRVYKKYLLDYNTKNGTTSVSENYFGGE